MSGDAGRGGDGGAGDEPERRPSDQSGWLPPSDAPPSGIPGADDWARQQQPSQPAPAQPQPQQHGGSWPGAQEMPYGGPPQGQQQQTFQPYGAEQAVESNGKAVTSMVLGILGLLVCPLVLSVVAIVLGTQARREIDASQGRQGNRTLATIGIVTGWVGVAFGILIIIFFVLVGVSIDGSDVDTDLLTEPSRILLGR